MKTLEWLSRLIAFNSTSRHSNLELIALVQDYFKQHHLSSRLSYDVSNNKANLFATLPSVSGEIDGGIILSGHTDVVPVDGQMWATNPFSAVVKDNKVYGRGACDMKGFIATMLALLPEFQAMKLNHPVHFALSYDEETGCEGAHVLIADFLQAGIQPKWCIVGEPTDMHAVIAHKGIQHFRCQVQGLAAHSSLTPHACNAIEYAANLICYLRSLADEMKRLGPFDDSFDVPYTTLSTNTIHGGSANNIIPEACEFVFEFRHLPTLDAKAIEEKILDYVHSNLLPQMRNEYLDAKVTLDNIAGVPAFEAMDNQLIKLVQAANGEDDIHKVAYATEAGLFQKADIATVVCGPGNIAQAHKPNEFVTLEQLQKCETFLRKIVRMV